MSQIRPFLSHRRTDQGRVIELRDELRLRGAGGWRDLDDLLLGDPSSSKFVDVIQRQTGGFIWYATPSILSSAAVNSTELPTALSRQRVDPSYKLVPAFTGLSPSQAKTALTEMVGDPDRSDEHDLDEDRLERLFDQNGDVRGGRSFAAFHTAVAKRYVRSAVTSLGRTDYTVAFASLNEPDLQADLTFDWRGPLVPVTRQLADGALPKINDALQCALDAVLVTTRRPVLNITGELPLPLALLVGHRWRVTTGVTLNIEQRSAAFGQHRTAIHAGGAATPVDREWVQSEPGAGPANVVGLSVVHDRTAHMRRYAEHLGASRLSLLHVDRFDLGADEIRGLARHLVTKLVAESGCGHPLHLLLAAPWSVATLTGTGMNGLRVDMPAWSRGGYTQPLTIG